MKKWKMNDGRKANRTRKGKWFWKVTGWVGVLALIAGIGVLGLPEVSGVRVMAVLSGSMEPVLPVGGLAVVRACEGREVQVGDVISFRRKDVVVTHRVIEADRDAGRLRTKGDANEEADGGTVGYEDVIGKVWVCVPWLGYAAVWLQNPGIRAGALVLLAGLFLLGRR